MKTLIDPKTWTREAIERHSVDMRQFIDFRQSTLLNGMRMIETYNSSGLTFTILPDRGLDIWTAYYKGIPLTWISQGSPHPPDFGQRWLQQFNGGLLTTCGLTHVGPPEKDDLTGEWRDIHGRYSRLRAGELTHHGKWAESTNLYQRVIGAGVSETALFGSQLRLYRRYEIRLGEPTIRIMDTVENLGDKPVPLMLLYHINLGYPLISEGTEFLTAHKAVYPRDVEARAGVQNWSKYEAATAGYPEQVFFHHPLQDSHWSEAMLLQQDLALRISWNSDTLPYLTQWKNTRQGIYVSGIEPANCIPEGLNAARLNKRLQVIQPGESISFYVQLEILEGQNAIQAGKQNLDQLGETGVPVANCQLDDYAHFAQQE